MDSHGNHNAAVDTYGTTSTAITRTQKALSRDTRSTPLPSYHLPSSSNASLKSVSPLASNHVRPSNPPLASGVPSSTTLTPQRIASLRGTLGRRRSSFPPATIDQITASIATSSSQVTAQEQLDLLAELGLPELTSMWAPVGWDTLLNFEGETKDVDSFVPPSKASPAPEVGGLGMTRVRSEPGDKAFSSGASAGGSSRTSVGGGQTPLELAKMSQLGGDRAWKTILASQVEVEGVGQLGVARVLQEVWRRGGGDQVTNQGLWPSIIISLSLPAVESPGFRLTTPSAHAALALQNLYNLTLRHWEPSIFTGLLSSFGAQVLHGDIDLPSMLGAAAGAQQASTTFGVSTPQKELDMSQWTNLTPGTGADWSFLNSTDHSSAFAGPFDKPSVPSSSLAFEVRNHRRDSTSKSIEEEEIRGLDEILAQMEEGMQAREMAAFQEQLDAASVLPDLVSSSSGLSGRKRPADDLFFQMPTPETDSSDITILSGRGQSSGSSANRKRQTSFAIVTPPSSNSSPLTVSHSLAPRPPGGQSAISRSSRNAQLATPSSSTQSLPRVAGGKKRIDMQVAIPMATFVPPPPMCMFFSPVFHDLQKDKVGVWKGDLEVRGKGGGKFSVLIIGETSTGHMWQSHMWPSSVVYPPDAQANEASSATATMIPVSQLAREGFTPAAMGMVLCNDANIEAYVNMVQGLHAEGVAFHLSTPGRLPIVFLPAKFDSNDPLQRLGVAFMTKPGVPYPSSIPVSTKVKPTNSALSDSHSPLMTATTMVDSDEPKKKKRRQSAPAGSLPMPKPASGKHRKRESGASIGLKERAIPEEAVDDDR